MLAIFQLLVALTMKMHQLLSHQCRRELHAIVKMMYVALTTLSSSVWKGTDIMQSVFIDSGSEDESNVILTRTSKVKPKSAQASTAIKAKPKSKPRSAHLKVPTFEPLEAKPKSKPHSANVKVPKPESESEPEPEASNISGVAASDVNALPEFALSTWGTSFLPTLYNRLACAPDPFVLDADMVKVIQEIIDLVYPDSDYQVRVNDRIFTMVSLLSFTVYFQMTDMFLGEGSPQ
jgi:hypothetical protein